VKELLKRVNHWGLIQRRRDERRRNPEVVDLRLLGLGRLEAYPTEEPPRHRLLARRHLFRRPLDHDAAALARELTGQLTLAARRRGVR
jgi:hypothetical protein